MACGERTVIEVSISGPHESRPAQNGLSVSVDARSRDVSAGSSPNLNRGVGGR